jgi:hypothetical protein
VKRCSKCQEEKPVNREHFYFRKGSPRAQCKACMNEAHEAWKLAHPEEWAAVQARHGERRRARRAAGPGRRRVTEEGRRERRRRWAEANRERIRELERERYWADPEPFRARCRARGEARQRRDPYTLALRSDPCCYCGEPMEHLDHIVPVYAGGEDHWTNFTASCAACNQNKASRSLLVFLRGRCVVTDRLKAAA